MSDNDADETFDRLMERKSGRCREESGGTKTKAKWAGTPTPPAPAISSS